MSGTAARSAKVLACMIRRPRDVPRYLAHNVLRPRGPADLGLPWMSYAVIDLLEQHLHPASVVHEYGAGGSTLFFAARARTVHSVESSREWYDVLTRRLARDGMTNVNLTFGAADFAKPDTFVASEFWAGLPAGEADVILIDAEDHHEGRGCRPQLFRYAEQHVRSGGLIVVDDADRYTALRTNNNALSVLPLRGVGPGRRFISLTDVYFY